MQKIAAIVLSEDRAEIENWQHDSHSLQRLAVKSTAAVNVKDLEELNAAVVSAIEDNDGILIIKRSAIPKTDNWLEGLAERLAVEEVVIQSTTQSFNLERGRFKPAAIGGVMGGASGIQGIESDQLAGKTVVAEHLDCNCILYSAEALKLVNNSQGCVFDASLDSFASASDDLLLSLDLCGGRLVVAMDQRIDKAEKEAATGGCSVALLEKWHDFTQRSDSVTALVHVDIETSEDLQMLEQTLKNNGQIFDSFAFMLCSLNDDFEGTAEQRTEQFTEWIRSTLPEDKPFAVELWQGMKSDRSGLNTALHRFAMEKFGNAWHFRIEYDEMIPTSFSRDKLRRLLQHPDPYVRIYDVSLLFHWIDQQHVRNDQPYGSPDHSQGTSSFRLWRVNYARPRQCGPSGVPSVGVLARQVAAIRLRCLSLQSTERRDQLAAKLPASQVAALTGRGGVILKRYSDKTAIGFSMLTHSREKLADIQRHLNTLHAVTEHAVIVWTDKAEPSEQLQKLVKLYGADMIKKPFTDSLSECRNAGLNRLRAKGSNWVLSFDPDEMLTDPIRHLTALRAMAESDMTAFIFRFANLMPDSEPTMSETVRMFQINRSIQYSYRVHESIDPSVKAMREAGQYVQIQRAPFTVLHLGSTRTDQEMQKKLESYTDMLIKDLEDNPDHPSAWVGLALQFSNDGQEDNAMTCLKRAMKCSFETHIAHKELALTHLRKATKHLKALTQSMPSDHPVHVEALKVLKGLPQDIDQPILGAARTGDNATTSTLRMPCTL